MKLPALCVIVAALAGAMALSAPAGEYTPSRDDVIENLGQDLGKVPAEYAQKLPLGARRVCEWPENVEDGPHCHLFAGSYCVLHCGVEGRRKEEPDARFLEAGFDLGRLDFQIDAKCCQHVGAAAGAGGRPVSVFGNGESGARCHKSRGGRNIEGV